MQAGFSEDSIQNFIEIGRKLLDGASFTDVYNEQVINHSKSLLFWKDCNSRYLACNQKIARLAGIANPRLAIGKCDYDMAWSQAESHNYRKDDQEILNYSKSKINIEETLHPYDGSYLILLTSKFPIYSSCRKKIGLIGIATDVTEHKQFEQQLLQISHNLTENFGITQPSVFQQLVETINRLNKISDYLKTNDKKYICIYKNKQITFTARQLQCIAFMMQGKTNKQIGKLLKLSPRTVEYYLMLIKQKLDCATKTELIDVILSSTGFIDDSKQ